MRPRAPGLLTTPLRDRFGIQHRLDHYGAADLARIVDRSARVLGDRDRRRRRRAIAERSRGTPRVANRLLKRVRDYAEVRGGGVDRRRRAGAALDLLEVDQRAWTAWTARSSAPSARQFGGGPVGLSTLAVALHVWRSSAAASPD